MEVSAAQIQTAALAAYARHNGRASNEEVQAEPVPMFVTLQLAEVIHEDEDPVAAAAFALSVIIQDLSAMRQAIRRLADSSAPARFGDDLRDMLEEIEADADGDSDRLELVGKAKGIGMAAGAALALGYISEQEYDDIISETEGAAERLDI